MQAANNTEKVFGGLLETVKQFDKLHIELTQTLNGQVASQPASVLDKLNKQAATVEVNMRPV